VAAAAALGDRVRAGWRSIGIGALIGMAMRCQAAGYYVTVAGLGGEADYEQRFTQLAQQSERVLKASAGATGVYTLMGTEATRAHLVDTLQQIAKLATPADDFVLLLIGHGSFDGEQYKFNLTGPDISAAELASLCNRIAAGRQLIVNTSSASGGSIAALQRPGRAVIAATKSGTEKNATVFARYWLEALQDPTADVDKNEAISALEAFQYASTKTAAFYASQKRLATEHAVFEDTGKNEAVRSADAASGEGRLLASISVVRFGSAQQAMADPAKHALLLKKEQLEQSIDRLKYQRAALSPEEYRQKLTSALLALAKVQQELDQ
jgi:hypothetical protein